MPSAFSLPKNKIMKYIKQLPEFSLIFLHPLECPKCIAAEQNSCCDKKPDLPILAIKQAIRSLNKNYQAYETLYLNKLPPSKNVFRNMMRKNPTVQKCDLKNVPLLSRKKVFRKSIKKEPKTANLRFLPTRKHVSRFDILNKLEAKLRANKQKVFNGFSKSAPRKLRVIRKKEVPSTPSETCDLPVEQPKKHIRKISSKKNSVKTEKVRPVHEITKKSSIKKSPSSTESSAGKAPGKGTLKRKRWLREKLNNSNENHEDDMFENQKFELISELFENDTDKSDDFDMLKTPVFPFSLSPCERSPSPTYKDCYSPTDITELRNRAEEYRFRKGKKWKKELFPKNKKSKTKNSEKKLKNTFKADEVEKTLEAVARILEETQEKLNESESEDDYYTDLFKSRPSST